MTYSSLLTRQLQPVLDMALDMAPDMHQVPNQQFQPPLDMAPDMAQTQAVALTHQLQPVLDNYGSDAGSGFDSLPTSLGAPTSGGSGALPACVDPTGFNTGYGPCSTYAAGKSNANYCAYDTHAERDCALSAASAPLAVKPNQPNQHQVPNQQFQPTLDMALDMALAHAETLM